MIAPTNTSSPHVFSDTEEQREKIHSLQEPITTELNNLLKRQHQLEIDSFRKLLPLAKRRQQLLATQDDFWVHALRGNMHLAPFLNDDETLTALKSCTSIDLEIPKDQESTLTLRFVRFLPSYHAYFHFYC